MARLALRDHKPSETDAIKVSICCITFNHAAFVKDALNGFLEQECDFRVEIVIYDDGSTDGTADIIRDYTARFPGLFRTILMEDNQFSKGLNPYFGHVFPAARGDFIAICDGDDYWSDPAKLSLQVAALEADPEVALTFGTVRGVDEAGGEVAHHGGVRHDLSQADLKAAPPINTLTTCFRNIFRGAPVVPIFVRTSTIGDLMVWAMLGKYGRARYLAELKPANYRMREAGLLAMRPRDYQTNLTMVAHMHLAAHHAEEGDIASFETSIRTMVKYFNKRGKRGMLYFDPPSSWRQRLRLWLKDANRRMRNR